MRPTCTWTPRVRRKPGAIWTWRWRYKQASEYDPSNRQAAACLTAARGDWPDTAIIVVVVVVNAAVGLVQELRADRAVAALRAMGAPPRARVRRDGEDRIVDAADLVPDDYVLLSEAGDV